MRPAKLKSDHEDAALLRTLNERLAEADSPDAVWIDAEDVFAELEARECGETSVEGLRDQSASLLKNEV